MHTDGASGWLTSYSVRTDREERWVTREPTSRINTGRVELTWTNKNQRLITLDPLPDGARYPYRWVPRTDHRAAEIRLLAEVGKVGDDGAENLLIRGDALHALAALATDGAAPRNLTGTVRLVYLDPPFNTGKAFEAYEDNLEKSIWLTMMRDRLRQIQPLMRFDGSVWVHCDDSMMAPLRLAMDEVFGDNFIATVIWQKTKTRENRTIISTSHDYILVFATDKKTWGTVRNLLTFGDEQLARFENPDNDPRGDWASLPLHAKAGKGRRASQFFTITLPSGRKVDPPPGRCWVYTEPRYEELVADNRIYFGPGGDNAPRVKKFLAEKTTTGLVPSSIWTVDEVGGTQAAKEESVALFPGQTPFDTPKPEALMARIIEISTNPGDWVLDAFAGSATTAATAHKLGRRWATVEFSEGNIERYCLPRLEKVANGSDQGGISDMVGWEGGGGFHILDVAPSMFDETAGIVVLADWAVGGVLGEATAVQLGFQPEVVGPFCGRKGRTRLAVVDGLVSIAAAELLLAELPEGEILLICGTGLEPDVAAHLAAARPGSAAQLIPAAILNSYARPRRWSPTRPRRPLGEEADGAGSQAKTDGDGHARPSEADPELTTEVKP